MRELQLRSLAMALATGFLLATGAGCSGGNPCDDVECTDGQVCNQDSGVCEAPADKCEGVTCDDGQSCNPANGQCEGLCAAVTCNETESCNPANGQCESKCKPGTCSATETCVPTTGECVGKCESATKPTGKAACADGQLCEASTGNCVSACKGKTCPYAQWCDANDGGKCKPKSGPGSTTPPAGYPGTACENVDDCYNPDIGGTQDCLEEFVFSTGSGTLQLPAPGGYCTNSCGSDADCASGSMCLGLCVSICARDADCRDGFRCTPVGAGVAACLGSGTCDKENPDDCSPIGGDCVENGDCIDGAECLAETGTNNLGQEVYSGFAGGYCAWIKRSTDVCPDGSTALKVSQQDPTQEICLKDCDYGVVGSCSLDEACQPVAINQQTGEIQAAVCLDSDCSVDSDCQVAQCSATNMGGCGTGQECQDENGDEVTGTTVGTCSTRDRCGDEFGTCRVGECVDGQCLQSFCEPTLGTCKFDCNVDPELKQEGGKWISPLVCGEGATCDIATGQCQRGCVDDAGCGPNAVCGGDGQCVARCHRWNEATVCGDEQVCNFDTGRCQAPCTAGSCGGGEVCAEDTGRCQRSCDAAVDPKVCGGNEYCDDGGFCQTKCTATTEISVCDPANADPAERTYCQVSTGKCLPSCANDPSICGAEACSVAPSPSTVARCGQTCTNTTNCGAGGYNEALSCQGPSGARTCAAVACDAGNPCALGTCNDGVCENTCTDDAQCGPGRVCGNGSPRLCEDAPPPTCDDDPGICDATEACVAGECVLRCDEGGTCDPDQYCNGDTGLCDDECSSDDQCEGDEFCGTGDPRVCVEPEPESCNDEPTLCDAAEVCDADTGSCVLRCDDDDALDCEDGFECNETSGFCEPEVID